MATPRSEQSLLDHMTLPDLVPSRFGGWISKDVSGLVAPATAGTLMSELYSQTVERVYQHPSVPTEVMMLLAYGQKQTNELQLHRPEVCYPAFGFRLLSSAPSHLALGRAVIPIRELVAASSERVESVAYWTRLGDFLPTSNSQQRLDRLKLALRGVVADGLLARFSSTKADTGVSFGMLRSFMTTLLRSVPTSSLPALIGSYAAKTAHD